MLCLCAVQSPCKCSTPEKVLTGHRPGISKFLHFSFYEPAYYYVRSYAFPSSSTEELGVATHVGDALTYKVLTKHHKIVYRSAIRSDLVSSKRNQSLSPLGGETAPTYLGVSMYICSKFPSDAFLNTGDCGPNVKQRMVTIDLQDLIGWTFLMDTEHDGQLFRFVLFVLL
jgi:hypothetical protein